VLRSGKPLSSPTSADLRGAAQAAATLRQRRPGGRSPVPGEEFVDALHRVIGQPGQHVGEPSLRVDAVELGGLDQGVDRRRPLAATIRSRIMMLLHSRASAIGFA
jgi:hypothetical protein